MSSLSIPSSCINQFTVGSAPSRLFVALLPCMYLAQLQTNKRVIRSSYSRIAIAKQAEYVWPSLSHCICSLETSVEHTGICERSDLCP